MERILTLKEEISKFFFEKHLDFLTSVPQQRIQEIMLSSCTRGNSGKLTDFADVFPVHRTTYGHFLSKGKWDEEKVAKTQETFTDMEYSCRKKKTRRKQISRRQPAPRRTKTDRWRGVV